GLAAVSDAGGEGVDRSAGPAPERRDLPLDAGHVLRCSCRLPSHTQSPPVLRGHAFGRLEHGPHPLPHGCLAALRVYPLIVADGLAAEPVTVCPGTAVMAVLAGRAVHLGARRGLAVVGISAADADCESLELPVRLSPPVA